MSEQERAPALMRAEPIHRLTVPFQRFLHVEAAGGVVLLVATVTALVLANSSAAESYAAFWKTKVGFEFGSFQFKHSLQHWINDGLMVIFFFVVGLEVKRELVVGELRDMRRAALPIAAALGGMLVPALLYLATQWGEPGQRGWGIPMATDIAFVVGCMAVMGSRVPRSLRVFLLSLAIADDIGAILVIAIGYTESVDTTSLLLALVGVAVVVACARVGVRSFAVYTILGALIWYGFHESGVHATIAGVILGLLTPARSYVSSGVFAEMLERVHDVVHGDWEAESHRAEKVQSFQAATREMVPPTEYLEHTLHPWVSFGIMPLFALANAGVAIRVSDLTSPVAIAIMLGLVVGKPVGILLFSWIAVTLKWARLPEGVGWRLITAGGCLAGIGFTMAIFIAGLAVEGELLADAKVGILGASLLAALLGLSLIGTSSRSSSA
ncbi:MAG: Na+/H+ antiporter NhaA [Candidatus Latescibacterota bacterium]|nr:MAG: Na+/H+ antiporter NhaA [Candidatus Latescibacterota bacterium]